MTTFLVIAQDSQNGVYMQPLTAASRDAAAALIKQALGAGLGVDSHGNRPALQIALIDLAAFGTVTPADGDPVNAQTTYTNQEQPAIADLPAFTATTIAQANTALQAIRTAFNTLLAELRAAGTIGT